MSRPDIRETAYKAIDSERNYQDNRLGNSARTKVEDNRSLGDLILLADVYVEKAKLAFAGAHPAGKTEALDQVRKVAALGVLIMEKHGIQFRQ
jgi:hypothetical protein